jgi:hypothetical protein
MNQLNKINLFVTYRRTEIRSQTIIGSGIFINPYVVAQPTPADRFDYWRALHPVAKQLANTRGILKERGRAWTQS